MIQTQWRQIQRALTNGHERNVTGEDGRQHKASADPLNHCTSLDLPLDVEDSGSTTNHGRTAGRPGSGFAAWKHGGSVEECLIEYLDAKAAYLYGGAVNAAVQQKESI